MLEVLKYNTLYKDYRSFESLNHQDFIIAQQTLFYGKDVSKSVRIILWIAFSRKILKKL